ncbi:MAG: alpha-ketoacid dehydrogenase subunit alpha/beta, partial [Chitinophagaceae bacterium]
MLNRDTLLHAYKLMVTAKAMGETYEANKQVCRYIHSTSRGHEAIQIATGMQMLATDWLSPYYRDDSMLLSAGFTMEELMLQLLAKKDDPFSGGRSYYSHVSNKDGIRPSIIHQSSATGMQAIPTTGLAQGLQFLETANSPLLKKGPNGEAPIVICSLGDGSMAEGEVSEAIQFAVHKKLPIIYLVQDNQWCMSAKAAEIMAMNAFEFTAGMKGLHRMQCDGSDFMRSYEAMQQAIHIGRTQRIPVLVHAKVPLLGHHSNNIRKEFYRDRESLLRDGLYDPIPKLRLLLNNIGFQEHEINEVEADAVKQVAEQFNKTLSAAEPDVTTIEEHVFAPTSVIEEKGIRAPKGGEKIVMVDAAINAITEIMEDHPEAILYGQDVGKRLGGIFREAASLAEQFGDERVFNTASQEAYIVGSTVGLSALGVKPIVEVPFGDYVYPAVNQLVTEISKSNYLTNGKFPVGMVMRVPVGASNGQGPYHSASIESTLLSIKGIKVAYPSNAADMKGIMKAAFYDPNPVVILEHKGLYWSKLPGTEDAKTPEPSRDYIFPLGKANVVLGAEQDKVKKGESIC